MATCTVTFRVRLAWWLPLYLRTLAPLMCLTMGTEPDMDKVERVMRRAIRISFDQV